MLIFLIPLLVLKTNESRKSQRCYKNMTSLHILQKIISMISKSCSYKNRSNLSWNLAMIPYLCKSSFHSLVLVRNPCYTRSCIRSQYRYIYLCRIRHPSLCTCPFLRDKSITFKSIHKAILIIRQGLLGYSRILNCIF